MTVKAERLASRGMPSCSRLKEVRPALHATEASTCCAGDRLSSANNFILHYLVSYAFNPLWSRRQQLVRRLADPPPVWRPLSASRFIMQPPMQGAPLAHSSRVT